MSKKKCFGCNQVLDIDNFYKDKSSPGGHNRQCKDCFRAYMKKYNQTDRWKKYHRLIGAEWRKNNPQKIHAHTIAGQLKAKIKKESCEKCGAVGKLHMHHPDYSQPALVLTLCIPCHEGVHHAKI